MPPQVSQRTASQQQNTAIAGIIQPKMPYIWAHCRLPKIMSLCRPVKAVTLDSVLQVTYLHITSHHPWTPRTSHSCICRQDKHGVSHPLSGAIAYLYRLDRTTNTLRLLATDATQVNNAQWRAGNSKIIKSWQPRLC